MTFWDVDTDKYKVTISFEFDSIYEDLDDIIKEIERHANSIYLTENSFGYKKPKVQIISALEVKNMGKHNGGIVNG